MHKETYMTWTIKSFALGKKKTKLSELKFYSVLKYGKCK